VNPPYSVMEKLKEQAQHRAKREVQSKDPNYLISKGPFALNEASINDVPDIALKGPQQDQSKLAENEKEKGETEGWDPRVTHALMVVIAAASVLALAGVIHVTRVMRRGRGYKIVNNQ